MGQVAQLVGALLILIAYALNQRGTLDARSASYLTINALGAGILGVVALDNRDWGFVLLETVWCAVSVWGLVQRARGRTPATP